MLEWGILIAMMPIWFLIFLNDSRVTNAIMMQKEINEAERECNNKIIEAIAMQKEFNAKEIEHNRILIDAISTLNKRIQALENQRNKSEDFE